MLLFVLRGVSGVLFLKMGSWVIPFRENLMLVHNHKTGYTSQ